VCFPVVGHAITDLFTVTCTGWRNCLNVDNDRLVYSYYVSPKDAPLDRPLYSGRNSTVKLYFPVGDANDDYHNQLTVVVSNYANYETTVNIYPVTVSRC